MLGTGRIAQLLAGLPSGDAGDYGKYVTSGAIALWQLPMTLDLLTALKVNDPTLRLAIEAECHSETVRVRTLLSVSSGTGTRRRGVIAIRVLLRESWLRASCHL